MSKPIVIVNYTCYNGGTLVLSCLCKTLREIGIDASLFLFPTYPCKYEGSFWNFLHLLKYHILTRNRIYIQSIFPKSRLLSRYELPHDNSLVLSGLSYFKFLPGRLKHSIVVYPEVIQGNPLNSNNIVRWLLSFYKFENDNDCYAKSDLFIAYRKIFNSTKLNPDNYTVTINYFDSTLYKQYNFSERHGNCYLIYKGNNRDDLPESYDGPIIDAGMRQEAIVEIFNKYKYCYFYDLQTFYSKIASVCGCIPILIPEKGKVISDYRKLDDSLYGHAWGDSPAQIQYAIETRDLLLKELDFNTANRNNAECMVAIMQRRFGSVKLMRNGNE